MNTNTNVVRRRGRPPKSGEDRDTRELILRAGLDVLTEKGFAATGIDEILSRVSVPKGSFYHYFASKEAYGLALIDAYATYFAHKLDRHFNNINLLPIDRINAFIIDAKEGMERYDFQRGCLIGNLGQEMGALPDSFREKLIGVFRDWEVRLATCLAAAQAAGQVSKELDCLQLAASFWTGWEGAVLRAKLERTTQPLSLFAQFFFSKLD